MFVVEEGRLRTFTEENGRRHYLAYLRKGDFFGEMSIFKAEPRNASVEAVSPCKLLELAPVTFEKLLKNSPAFRAQIEERIEQYDYKTWPCAAGLPRKHCPLMSGPREGRPTRWTKGARGRN
jgi:signal-transduction protein with cAMP-binding, CBS, and nucleotidyltransferase domain